MFAILMDVLIISKKIIILQNILTTRTNRKIILVSLIQKILIISYKNAAIKRLIFYLLTNGLCKLWLKTALMNVK